MTSSGTSNNWFAGSVDDVRFYDRVLTGTELTNLYNNGNVWPYTDISSTSLKFWHKLDDASGSSAVDSSGNGNTLTLTNTPPWVTGIVATGSTVSPGSGRVIIPGN